MGEIGSGTGTSYPNALDTDSGKEVDFSTFADAAIPNDLASGLIAVEAELGTNPSRNKATVREFLEVEHNADGTHGTLSNVTLGDNITLDGAGWPRFSVYRSSGSADQSVASTGAIVAFNAEDFDDGSYYNTTTFKFRPATSGVAGISTYYILTAQLYVLAVPAGKTIEIQFRNVATTVLNQNFATNDSASARDVTVSLTILVKSTGVDSTANDFFVFFLHDNASALDIDRTQANSFFMGSRVA